MTWINFLITWCTHLEAEGYDMHGVVEALGDAIHEGKVEPDKEADEE